MRVAIVHDYFTQLGGAERVALALGRAFPGAPMYTILHNPESTFDALTQMEVHTSALNGIAPLRRHHRLALPVLAAAVSRLHIEADVAICSTSGWAHGVASSGRKIVYCHTPARWLYQPDRYLGGRRLLTRAVLTALSSRLRAWDARAADSADRYVAVSSVVRERISACYGIAADVVAPPWTIDVDGPRRPAGDDAAPESGFVLCAARLVRWKMVDSIAAAFAHLPGERLVVAGAGPEERRLRAQAPDNVRFLGPVADPAAMAWLYANCSAVVAAGYEDFGLTPVEGYAFGKPAAVLRWGGFMDTTVEGVTAEVFDEPTPAKIAAALQRVLARPWDAALIRQHAAAFSEESFARRMRAIVDEVS